MPTLTDMAIWTLLWLIAAIPLGVAVGHVFRRRSVGQ